MNRPGVKVRRPQLLYIIGCEGANQEKLYFDKVQSLVNSIESRTCDLLFEFAEPFGGDPKCVVERVVLKSIGKLNKGAVFDFDGKRIKYEEAIDLAMEKQITLGYTNYCFDLWLLLHKKDFFDCVNSQNDYADELRHVYGLKEHANIKKKENVESIVKQINIMDIRSAIARADILAGRNLERIGNKTPKEHEYYDNPDTQVHKLLLLIFQKTGVAKVLGL